MTKSILKIEFDGTKYYYNLKNQLHRENGPASIYPNGSMFWHINDKDHRIDGPSSVYNHGDKLWFINDVFIREFQYD